MLLAATHVTSQFFREERKLNYFGKSTRRFAPGTPFLQLKDFL